MLTNTTEKKYSKKVMLTKNLMQFDEDLLIFANADIENDILEVTMGIGNHEKGQKFHSNVIYLKTLKINQEVQAQWSLYSNSFILVKYKIFEEDENKIRPSIISTVSTGNKKSDCTIKVKLAPEISSTISKASSSSISSSNTNTNTNKSSTNLPFQKNPISNSGEQIFYEDSSQRDTVNTENSNITSQTIQTSPFGIKDDDENISLHKNTEKKDSLPGVRSLISFFQQSSTQASLSKRPSKNMDDSLVGFEKDLNKTCDLIGIIGSSTNNKDFPNFPPKFDIIEDYQETYEKEKDRDSLVNKINLLSGIDKASMNMIHKDIQNKIKKSVIIPNSNSKDNFRKEMSVLYRDQNETESDLNSLNSLNSVNRSSIATMSTSNSKNNNSAIVGSKSRSLISVSVSNPNPLTLIRCDQYILPDKDENLLDSFCEAFFISGVPKENAKAINESENYIAPCRHLNCSMLPAYKPEILCRYPVKDSSRLELSALVASLCYPLGVKLCYSIDEKNIKTVKNYSTAIINQDGSRFYMVSYHFFVKFENGDFVKTYKINPVKEFLHLEKILPLYENNPTMKKKLEIKLEKQLDICTQFNFNEYVYVPFAACMISKYPYIQQMEKCIQTILKMSTDKSMNYSDLTKLILHLTREIPIPLNNKKLKFHVPNLKTALCINAPIYKDLPILNDSISKLIDIFSIENIINIHHLMLLEQKILFVSDEYCQLSEVIESFACLLYPMQWTHTYIPILSEEMIKYLQSFMPFIMGIDETLLEHAKPYFAEEDSIYLVYIKKDLIDISGNKKGKKLKRKELIQIPEYPTDIEKFITKKITELKKVVDKFRPKLQDEINQNGVEICIREIFLKSIIRMIGDYQKYNQIVDDLPVFNTESFVSNRPEKDKHFYSELTETQIFNHFLQSEAKECFPFFYKINERLSYNLWEGRGDSKPEKTRSSSITARRSTLSKLLNDEGVEQNYKDLIINSYLKESQVKNISQLCPFNDFNDAASSHSGNQAKNSSKPGKNGKKETLQDLILNYQNSETYLIPPYFIPNSHFVDASEISQLIKGDNWNILGENNRIFSNSDFKLLNLNFKNESIYKVNRYIIPNDKRLMNTGNNNNSLNTNLVLTNSIGNIKNIISGFEQRVEQVKKNKIFLKSTQKKGEQLTENEIEEIKIIVNETLQMIFSSEKLNIDQKKILDSIFRKPYGRELFSKGIYQTKFNQFQEHQLSKESFDDLFSLLFQAMLSEGEDLSSYNQVRLLTKATFYYFKNKGYKQKYYLYEELKNKKGTFSIWKNENFWSNWFNMDKADKTDLHKRSDEENSFNLLLDISRIMSMLNIDVMFILNILVDSLGKQHIKTEKLLNELNVVILKQARTMQELNF